VRPRAPRGSTAAAALLLLGAASAPAQAPASPATQAKQDARAQPRSPADCAAAYPAAWGRAGKDVPWVPTFDAVILAMLGVADVKAEDRLLDLGAGDGRIPITAAKPPFGARARGIEFDPELARLAACLVRVEGLADRATIDEGDIFTADLGDPSVVTMYLLPQVNRCVRPRLLALAPGTRVVSHQYGMAEWEPDRSIEIQGRTIHFWVVPARVDGVWDFEDSEGAAFTLDLHQSFATLAGEVVQGEVRTQLRSASLKGVELRFAYAAAGAEARFSGTVRGGEITGVRFAGRAARTAVGRLRGALRGAAWAEIPPDCRHYYER
jgi:hypothetical protein